MYFTPDGRYAIVVAEAASTWTSATRTPSPSSTGFTVNCAGVDHIDFAANGAYLIATCEFSGRLVRVDLHTLKVVGYLNLPGSRAAGHQARPRRPHLLRRRQEPRRGVADRRRDLPADRVHPDRPGRARPVPEPRRPLSVRDQPGQRLDHRDQTSRPGRSSRPGGSRAAAARTWATCPPTGRCSGCPGATTTSSMPSPPSTGHLLAKIPVGSATARAVRMAPAGPLLPGPHRDHPMSIHSPAVRSDLRRGRMDAGRAGPGTRPGWRARSGPRGRAPCSPGWARITVSATALRPGQAGTLTASVQVSTSGQPSDQLDAAIAADGAAVARLPPAGQRRRAPGPARLRGRHPSPAVVDQWLHYGPLLIPGRSGGRVPARGRRP